MYKATVLSNFFRAISFNLLKIPEEKIRFVIKYLLFKINLLIRRPVMIRGGYELPIFCATLGLKGQAAEIGVAEGDYSESIMLYGPFSALYSIDPWKEFPEDIYTDINNLPQDKQEKRYERVKERLKKYGQRSKIMRMTSLEAAEFFKDNTLDFIFIDANHKYQACKQDLTLWWLKLKTGGIFAGDDYLNAILPSGTYGVKQAVDEFVTENQQNLFVINGKWPVWYLIKK